MATLNTKSFASLVQSQAAAIQGRASALLNFTVGSVLRALVEANAGVAMWLQGLAVKILAVTRASTSSGADLDSFVGDYGVTRLGSQSAIGSVTFSRFSPSAQAVVPVGSVVVTSDGQQTFVVVADPTNNTYNAGVGGYVIPAGVSSVSVPVVAQIPGTGANVQPGSISLIQSSIPFVDTVTNAGQIAGGSEAESDGALRLRFVQFIASLSKATPLAIGYAITSKFLGVQYALVENEDYEGNYLPGFFYVVCDDGSGTLPPTLQQQIYLSIDEVRAASVRFAVFGPQIVQPSVSMSVVVKPGFSPTVVKGEVGTAIRNYINSMTLGDGLTYSRLAQIVYEASQGVQNAKNILLNGTTADVEGDPRVRLVAGVITVN